MCVAECCCCMLAAKAQHHHLGPAGVIQVEVGVICQVHTAEWYLTADTAVQQQVEQSTRRFMKCHRLGLLSLCCRNIDNASTAHKAAQLAVDATPSCSMSPTQHPDSAVRESDLYVDCLLAFLMLAHAVHCPVIQQLQYLLPVLTPAERS